MSHFTLIPLDNYKDNRGPDSRYYPGLLRVRELYSYNFYIFFIIVL